MLSVAFSFIEYLLCTRHYIRLFSVITQTSSLVNSSLARKCRSRCSSEMQTRERKRPLAVRKKLQLICRCKLLPSFALYPGFLPFSGKAWICLPPCPSTSKFIINTPQFPRYALNVHTPCARPFHPIFCLLPLPWLALPLSQSTVTNS